MKEIQERVLNMVNGEKKRREIAEKFVTAVHNILYDNASDIWGDGDADYPYDVSNAVWLKKQGTDDMKSDFYFRYKEHCGERKTESEGFYLSRTGNIYWGDSYETLKGDEYWYFIRILIYWVKDFLPKMIEKKQASRESLLNLIKQ